MLKITRHFTNTAKFSSAPLQLLTEQEQQLKEKARNFAQTHIKPLVKEMDKSGKIDEHLLKRFFDEKLMGLQAPKQYGGTENSFFELALVVEELSKVDPAVALTLHLQNGLIAPMLREHGNDHQKEQYLRSSVTGSIGAFCLTETVSGSDAFAMKTSAQKTSGDDFLINGSKWGITNAHLADFFLVMANADPEKGYKGVTCFLVDKKSAGVRVGEKEENLGMRAAQISSVHFDNVRVPKSAILGKFGQGYKYAIELLNASRIVIGAQMAGLAQGCFDETIPFLQERKQFGTRLIDFQGLQHQIAKARVEIEAARLLTYNAAKMKDAGMPIITESAITKYFAPEVACKTAKRCIEWLGAIGYTNKFNVEKFYRDAVVGGIYEGTSNIQLNTIAKLVDLEYKKKKNLN